MSTRLVSCTCAAVLCLSAMPAATASGQNYQVETTKLLEVSGDVKARSCGGGCCEGHDSTACVGVQLQYETAPYQFKVSRTAIYDNVSCCDPQCTHRQMCGPFNDHEGPANDCPNNKERFSFALRLGLCTAPGAPFRVPQQVAQLGNVVNNSWTTGSKCSESDPFEPYYGDPQSVSSWGGFWDSCPNPVNPDIVCVPSDCTPGPPDDSHAVPRYAVEIVSPYGNENLRRWDAPDVMLRWRTTTERRLDSYRVVVYDGAGVFIDTRVPCGTETCSYVARFPPEAGSYYWWVQPVSPPTVGDQSRAGFFNLSPPETSCVGLGGRCASPPDLDQPATCAPGETTIAGSDDCPNTCCVGVVQPPDTPSCGQLGGDHCSVTSSCPWGYASLGTTRQNGVVECQTCCNQTVGDGYCEPGVEDCGTSPSDCPCWMAGTTCNASGSPGQCVDRCSAPAYHNHSGSCGQADECGHVFGSPRDCLPSCGAMGGNYCSQSGSCPSGYNSLGQSNDCSPCCKTCISTGCPAGSCGWKTDNCGKALWCGSCAQSCGQMGGDYCSQSASCPPGYDSLGRSSDCSTCCRQGASCGAVGGDYCSQSGSCPGGYADLGRTWDCNHCCLSQ